MPRKFRIPESRRQRLSVGRRQIRPVSATVFAAVAVAVAVVGSSPPGQASARPISDCPDLHVVVVPGTLDSSNERDPHDQSGVLAPTANAAAGGLPSETMQTTYVPYPADFGYTSDGTPYTESVATGVDATNEQVEQVYQQCGDQTDISIVGYSQGADVAHRVATEIGNGESPVPAERIRGVYLVSDPNREAGSDVVPGSPGQSAPLNGARTHTQDASVALGGGINTDTSSDFGALTGRVVSLCATGDFACAMPENTQLVRIGANVAEQIHIDTNDPVQIAGDLAAVALRSSVRTAAYIVDSPHWMLSSESFGTAVQKGTDPYYSGPELRDVSLLSAAIFVAEFPIAIQPKLEHERNAVVDDNLGLVTMASYPEYWYPGLSHGSYFGPASDSSGQTDSQYVSTWLRESATSDAPSGSVVPEKSPEPAVDPATEPLPAPTVSDAVTAAAVAETTSEATMQLPEVTDALTDEANKVVAGTSMATQVRDVTAVIDTSASQVDQVFDVVEKVADHVSDHVAVVTDVVDPALNPAGSIGTGHGLT